MDKVSIIVPIFNSKKYLDECLKSIVNQSYKNIEIILVDDESTDDSLDICYKYAKSDNRVRIIQMKHSGVAVARNRGIDSAEGKYLCFIDSDDIIAPCFVEHLLNLAQKNNAEIAEVDTGFFKKRYKIKKKREKLLKLNSAQMSYRLYNKNGIRTVFVTNKIYSANIFQKIRFTKDIENEDEFIIHKLFFETDKNIIISNLKLYLYRQHKNSRQQTFNKEKIKILDVFDDRKKYFINNKKLLDVNEVAQIDMILYLYHLCKAYNYTSEERILKEQFEDKYKSLNVKINLKKKVKYYMFSRFPNFVAYIISLKQRKYHVR